MTGSDGAREDIAQKRGAQLWDAVCGAVLFALAAAALVSVFVNADRGAGFIAVGAAAAAMPILFGGYCVARYIAQKKLPDVLIYREGDALFCYEYKKKGYTRIPLADIRSVEGGALPRDVRAGSLRVCTQQGKTEVVEVADPFAAREHILRLCVGEKCGQEEEDAGKGHRQ